MSKINSIIKKVSDVFLPDKQNDSQISNQKILNELKLCFEASLKHESFGKRMLFHTYYYIILSKEDYLDREQAYAEIVKETINHFYELIIKNKKNYKDFLPISRYWYFQFSSASVSPKLKITIEKGFPAIVSTLTGTESASISSSPNIKATFRAKSTDPYATVDLNAEALRSLEVIAKGVFRVKFNDTLDPLANAPISEDEGIAVLSYVMGGQTIRYQMKDREIIVTKKNGANSSRHILPVDSKYVENEHLRIRHNSSTKTFELAAFAATTLNQREVKLSAGENMQWVTLGKKSEMLLGHMFSINFDAN